MPAPDPFPFVKPLLHRLDPETAHALTLAVLEKGVVPSRPAIMGPLLATTFLGRPLAHPIGLAAGFDKNARVFDRMYGQGFSFVEVGGVTPRAQSGNARPRVFRLPQERAIINRIGFANEGMERVAARLERRPVPGLLGVNLAANVDSADPAGDFVLLARRFAPLADFLTLDISCPNTANGTLFLKPAPLADLLQRIDALFAADPALRRPALFAKLSPDIDRATLEQVVATLAGFRIDALIVSNTTALRPPGLRGRAAPERGGLSGPPLFERSTQMLAQTYALTAGRIPLVGLGGIASGAGAYAKIRAGASVLQLYTAMVYRGPAIVAEIARDLAALLRRDGFTSLGEAVGSGQAIGAVL